MGVTRIWTRDRQLRLMNVKYWRFYALLTMNKLKREIQSKNLFKLLVFDSIT